MKVHYYGNRPPIVNRLEEIGNSQKYVHLTHQLQVIDLGGPELLNMKNTLQRADRNLPTVILSTRRYNLNDDLGYIETELLTSFKNGIIYRLSPLDINFEFYRGWAGVTGTILTSLHAQGVAWINTSDVIEALLIPEEEIYTRSGKAFELTGPRLISMEELKSIFVNEHIIPDLLFQFNPERKLK